MQQIKRCTMDMGLNNGRWHAYGPFACLIQRLLTAMTHIIVTKNRSVRHNVISSVLVRNVINGRSQRIHKYRSVAACQKVEIHQES